MDEKNRDASIHLIEFSSFVHMSEPRFRPKRRFIQESRNLAFGTGPTKLVRLHSDAIVAPQKFNGVSNALQVCGNPECRDILRLLLLTHAQFIGDQHPRG